MATRRSELSLQREHETKSFVMKAHVYKETGTIVGDDIPNNKRTNTNITNWYIQEKIDGVRAVWDGECFRSCSHKIFPVHKAIIDIAKTTFGDRMIDGEFSCGRGMFQRTVSIVRNTHSTLLQWMGIKYYMFDCITDKNKTYRRRYKELKSLPCEYANFIVLPILATIDKRSTIQEQLDKIMALGGEGLIIRNPKKEYLPGRSSYLLKIKKFTTTEVIVTGYTDGEGKYSGMVGALVCEQYDGRQVLVGTGLTDADRMQPPPIGSEITIKYQNLSTDGIPRHPVFVEVRDYE